MLSSDAGHESERRREGERGKCSGSQLLRVATAKTGTFQSKDL